MYGIVAYTFGGHNHIGQPLCCFVLKQKNMFHVHGLAVKVYRRSMGEDHTEVP